MTHVKITIFRDHQDPKDLLDPLDLQAQEVLLDVLVPQESVVSKEPKVPLVLQDLLDFKDLLVFKEFRDPQEFLETEV